MDELLLLKELFTEYEFEEAIGSVEVTHVDIDRDSRRVTAELRPLSYVSAPELEKLGKEIAKSYRLGKVLLLPKFPPEAMDELAEEELNDFLISRYSMLAGTLAGCRWSREGDSFVLSLRANGKADVEKQLPALKNYLLDRFGRSAEFRVEAGNALEGAALEQELERLRMETLSSVPTAAPQKGKEEKKEQKAAEAILGKPFSGAATPMKELSLDMYHVTVEGEVFAINHKELKKRKA